MVDEKSVSIQCPDPECAKEKSIQIPKYLLAKKKVGTIKIQIHAGVCCEHEFIAFIDRKGKVRGYEHVDMVIDLSEYVGRKIGEHIYLRDLITKYGEYAVRSMIHSILLGHSIVILRGVDEKIHSKEINFLLNSFLPQKYQIPVVISTMEENLFQKAKIDDSLVINPQGVIANTPWADIPLDYEQNLLIKTLDILDDKSQSIIAEDDIEFAFEKVLYMNEVIKDIEKIFEDDLKEKIQGKFMIGGVSDKDIMLYKQMSKERFDGPIERIKIRSFSKLKEGLW